MTVPEGGFATEWTPTEASNRPCYTFAVVGCLGTPLRLRRALLVFKMDFGRGCLGAFRFLAARVFFVLVLAPFFA